MIDLFGPSDLLTMDDAPGTMKHDAPDSPESKLIGGPIQKRAALTRQASPLTHVSVDDAPFLIIHGTDDPLVPFDQSVRLDAALDRAGVSSTLITVQDGKHGGFNSPEVTRLIRDFIDQRLTGKPVTIKEQTVPAGPRRR